MLVFKGKGVLLPVAVLVSQFVTAFLTGAVYRNVPYFAQKPDPIFLSFALGFALGSYWIFLIKDTYYRKDGKKVILYDVENSFFWIQLKHWVHILNVAALICLVEWVWTWTW